MTKHEFLYDDFNNMDTNKSKNVKSKKTLNL